MPFSMSNNSKHIINNLQELAKKPKYEYEWYNKGTVASQIIFYFICHFWYKFLLFLV